MGLVEAGINWERVQTVKEGLWLDFETRVSPWNTHGMHVPFEKTLPVDAAMPETPNDLVLARACQLLAREHPEIVIRPVRNGVIVQWRHTYDGFNKADRDLIRRSGGEVMPLPDSAGLFGIEGKKES